MKSKRMEVVALVLVFLTSLGVAAAAVAKPRMLKGGLLLRKAHVSVVNYLREDLDLTVHCRSKQDDLGVRVLPFGANFSFVFRPDWKGVTLFYCGMQWNLNPVVHFNIYDSFRDQKKCQCYTYIWRIMPLGPCMLNYTSSHFDFCYPWNQNNIHSLP